MAPPLHPAAAAAPGVAESAYHGDVTPGYRRSLSHVRQPARCSACGLVFCVACEGSNHGEPSLCERCVHVYLPQLEAA